MRLHNLILAAAAVSSVASVPINVVRDASTNDAHNAHERSYSSLFKRVSPDVPPIMLFGQLVAPNRHIEEEAQTAQSSLAGLSHDLQLDVKAEVPSSPTQLSQPSPELQASPLLNSASASTSLQPAFAAGSKRKAALVADDSLSVSEKSTELNKHARLSDDPTGEIHAEAVHGSTSRKEKQKHLAEPSASLPQTSSGSSKLREHAAHEPGAAAESRQQASGDAAERDLASMSTQEIQDEFDNLRLKYFRERSSASPEEGQKMFSRLTALDEALTTGPKALTPKTPEADALKKRMLAILHVESVNRRIAAIRDKRVKRAQQSLPSTSAAHAAPSQQTSGAPRAEEPNAFGAYRRVRKPVIRPELLDIHPDQMTKNALRKGLRILRVQFGRLSPTAKTGPEGEKISQKFHAFDDELENRLSRSRLN